MFFEGDRLCEITFPIATIGIDASCNGILAKIIVDKYQTAPADSHIAVYALSKEYYMNFLAESMQDVSEAAKMAATAEVIEEKEKRPDAAALMKAIRHMIQSGKIDGTSGELRHVPQITITPTIDKHASHTSQGLRRNYRA